MDEFAFQSEIARAIWASFNFQTGGEATGGDLIRRNVAGHVMQMPEMQAIKAALAAGREDLGGQDGTYQGETDEWRALPQCVKDWVMS